MWRARYAADEASGAGASREYEAWADVIGVVSLGARDATRTTGEQFAANLRKPVRTRRRAR